MKYFLSKIVATPDVTLGFVAPHQPQADGPQIVHYLYDRFGDTELHGIDYQGSLDAQAILAQQHEECEVREVSFEELHEELSACRFAKEINAEIVSRIRARYSVDDELKIMKQDPASAEYVAMMAWIADCRAEGNAKKIALGIKQ